MSLISSPAQPGRIVRLRKKTARLSFDPNLGFHKVERVALSDVGQETVRDVANGNKYYFAFRPLNGHSGEESEEIGCLEEVSVATRCLTRDMARLLLCLLLTGWASLLGGYASAAADCSVPRELNSTRPDVDGAPTRVAIGIYLIDMQERLHSTGGGLVINSRPTTGTRNTARVPLTAASVQTEALQV